MITYVVLVNNVATAITVALSAAAVGVASNIVNTVAVVQGDDVSVQETNSGSAATVDTMVTLEFA